MFWQLVWTAALVWAQQSVLKRCGVPRGWKLGLVGVAVVLAVEPIRTTLGYGQVNTLLMALVVADLLPDRPGERRRIPQGSLIGLAAAIKLTPALFVVFAFLIGKRRAALTAIISFVGSPLLGADLPVVADRVHFWLGLAGGDTRTAAPLYTGNQSLLGVFYRLGDDSPPRPPWSGWPSRRWSRCSAPWSRPSGGADGEKVFAVALVGLCTCLASPLSWTHHYVWILPLGRGACFSPGLPRWVRALGGFWVVWVATCLPLAVLPYGFDRERDYDALQQLVANLGPLLGLALVTGLAWQLVIAHPAGRGPAVASRPAKIDRHDHRRTASISSPVPGW